MTEPARNPVPQPMSLGGGITYLLVLIGVIALGAAFYLVAVARVPVSEPRVLVSGLVALWFFGRAAMRLALPKRPAPPISKSSETGAAGQD